MHLKRLYTYTQSELRSVDSQKMKAARLTVTFTDSVVVWSMYNLGAQENNRNIRLLATRLASSRGPLPGDEATIKHE